uniref:FAE domain-containing protein n=1 Tax=Oryza nivara TaxID=4536 RepID=A0A0E0G7J8_ORYNI
MSYSSSTLPLSLSLFLSLLSLTLVSGKWGTVTRGRRLRAAASAPSCGAAVLVTHAPALRPRAKMELGCLVLANIAANDDSHACALQQEDDDDSGGR